MADKRIIEQTASSEIYSDDWFIKDSPSHDTSKILASDLQAYMQSGLKEMLTQAEYDALPSSKLSDGVVYYLTDTRKLIINGVIYGSGGGGGASSLSDLTDVVITSATDGQTLVYDATTQKWVNESGGSGGGLTPVELTKAEYDALTAEQKSDPTKQYFVTDYNPGGDSGIELDKNILVLSKNSNVPNYGTYTNTYTATKNCYVLAFNQCVHEEANDRTITATISSTGTEIATNYVENTTWVSPNRVHATRLSVYELSNEQTVTFTNTCTSTSNAYAIHFVLIIDKSLADEIHSITNIESECQADLYLATDTNIVNIDSSGLYLVVATSKAGEPLIDISCFTDGIGFVKNITNFYSYSASYALLTVDEEATVTVAFKRVSNYAHCGYQIYKIS